jgi:hypothetical protein
MMPDYCKLTHFDRTTYGDCQWIVGEWKETSGDGPLCSDGWIHVYEHGPVLAEILSPLHTDHGNGRRMWRVEIGGETKRDGQSKFGVTRCRLLEELPVPDITPQNRIEFAIRCAKRVCRNEEWNEWADRWLKGPGRADEARRVGLGPLRAELDSAVSASEAAHAAQAFAAMGAAEAAIRWTWQAQAELESAWARWGEAEPGIFQPAWDAADAAQAWARRANIAKISAGAAVCADEVGANLLDALADCSWYERNGEQ